MPAKKKATGKAKNPGKMTLADIWNNTDPSEASNQLPAGEHTVRLNSLELKEDEKKGTAVFAEYEAIEGEHEGRKLRQMYKLTDADGNKAQGAAYLMRDLALLGYEGIKGSKLKKTLATISEEQPMVVITAKESGQYMNAYLNGPADGDIDNSEGADDEIEVGSQVKGTNKKGKEIEGEVTDIDDDDVEVEDEKGKTHKCKLDDLELVSDDDDDDSDDDDDEGDEDSDSDDDDDDDGEGDGEDDAIEVGSEVTDGEITGEVTAIKGDKATVKDEDGKKHKLDLDTLELVDDTDDDDGGDDDDDSDDDDDEDADDDDEIEVGDTVSFEDDDENEQEGEVLEIKKNTATVKVGKKKVKVDLDELTKVDDDE